jgi:hypothetical protein
MAKPRACGLAQGRLVRAARRAATARGERAAEGPSRDGPSPDIWRPRQDFSNPRNASPRPAPLRAGFQGLREQANLTAVIETAVPRKCCDAKLELPVQVENVRSPRDNQLCIAANGGPAKSFVPADPYSDPLTQL